MTPDEVNRFLRDTTTRRFYMLEQYKNHLVKQAVGRLNSVDFPAVEDAIRAGMNRIRARGLAVTPRTHREVRDLFRTVEELVETAFRDAERDLLRDLDDLVVDEEEHERAMLGVAFPDARIVIPAVGVTALAVRERPFFGRTLGDWFGGLRQSQQAELSQQMQIGLTRGEPTETVVRRVRGTSSARYEDGVFGRGRRSLDALIRGSVAHAATQTREIVWGLNSEIILKEQWSCVLDAATCLECWSWQGEIFGVDEGPRPPLHVRCRCTMIPVGPGEESDIQSFDEWLGEQEHEMVVEALGVRRARLFEAGLIKVESFTDSVGRTYTLAELRAREPSAFRAAGID